VAAVTALQGLRDHGQLQPGQNVLVNGAAGGVGTFAVQIAKALGAEVTAVCSSRNVEMARSIGADHVVDYTRQDFTRLGQKYDLIFDCVSNHALSEYRGVLAPKGICVMAGDLSGRGAGSILWRLFSALVRSWLTPQKFTTFLAKPRQKDLATLHNLMKAGKITPVVDRRYTLREVPEALRYLQQRHARGKVVIQVGEGSAQEPLGTAELSVAELRVS
jgi:NADPH:quinone reductase-like Zn-dependent oxidoreductase